MREQRTKVNDKKIAKCAMHNFFQDWKTNQETRYSQRQLCLHCSGIAENQESYHNRNSEALKHIKPDCRRSLLLKVINFDRISQERAILPFWTKTKLYRTPEDLKTCQH